MLSYIKVLFIFVTVLTTQINNAIANELITELYQLTDEEKRGKYRKDRAFMNFSIRYGDEHLLEKVRVDYKLATIEFSKVVTCGGQSYPTVVIRRHEEDIPDSFLTYDMLYIYDESLKRINNYFEGTRVSNQLTDSPDKYRVTLQPKFTLENVEAFVCSSQVNICQAEEEMNLQCTFEDGRQANVCWSNNISTLKIGKSANQLEKSHELPKPFRWNLLKNVAETPKGLSGIEKSFSILDGDIDYSFENHWSARSRDDYDFHAEFNIRKDGKIIESNRCIEGSYD